MASQLPKENAKRNKNAIPGTLGQIDSEEGNGNNDDQQGKDNVERSEDNLPGVEGGSKDPIAEGTSNEEKLGDDDAEGESSSPQRTEYGPQGEASHSKGKPGMGNIITHTGDHQDSLAMSFDYKDSMGSSMVNVFKPLHVPGINATVTQDKTEIDDQRSSSSESFEVINKFDTERDGDDKEESEDGETEGQGEFDTDMSGGDQASAGPIGNMAPGDHSNNHKPDLCEAAEFQVIKKLGRYFLRDSKGKQSVLPQEIRYGPKFSIDGNLILDENENIFEIVKYENGRFHFKAISEGKVDNEESQNEGKSVTNSGDETQTMSSMPISFSDKNTTVENYRAHAVQRRNSVGEHQGSTRRQTPVDGNEAMPEHGRESVVGPPSSTYINQGQTKTNIQQTSGMNMGNTKTNSSQQTAGSRNAGYQEQTLETKPDKSKTVRDNPEATENDPMKTTNLAETSNTDSKKFNASVHKTSVDGKDVVVKEDLTELQQYTDNGNNSDDPTSPFCGASSDDEGSSTQAGRKYADVDTDTPPDTPPKTVLGAGCQDAAASGHSASKAMSMFPVEIVYLDASGQPTPVKRRIETDFETKMKLMYVVKQHALFTKKGQKIKNKMKAEVDFRNGTLIIKGLTFGYDIDTALAEMTAIILEDTDKLVLNEVPVTGLDGEEVCSSILKSEFGQIDKIYPLFDQENNICCCVYEKEFARQAEECINSSVKKMVEEQEASKYTEQITLSIVFSEVFNTDGMEDKFKECHPQVKCEIKDCKTEDLLIIQLSGDENKVKDAHLWIETEYERKFVVNQFGFKEVKQGQKVGDDLSEIVERKCLSLKENKSILFFYMNSETSQITICTTDQKSADLATNSLKKCLKETEFDADNISNPEKIQDFKYFAKGLEQNYCTVTIKGNTVHIVGLKEDIERAKCRFKEILNEIKDINTAKGAEYQPIPDDSTISQQPVQNNENKLEHTGTAHKIWHRFYGHAVMVAKARAKEFWEKVYVEFNVNYKGNQADLELEFQQQPDAKYMYKVSLQIPQWQGGEGKEKHRVDDQFQRLLKLMKEKHVYKATVQMCSYGNWPQNTLMKQILKSIQTLMNESQTVPLEILFCCARDDDYQSVCSVCEEVFGKATVDNEVISAPAEQTSKPLVTKVVTAQLDKYEVDAIVNSSNEGLDLAVGAVSKALSKRAGPELQREVKFLHPGKMDVWEILVSKGHGLKCKHVLHGVLPSALNDTKRKVQELEGFTFNCLRRAASLQCKSIAFPALGTGNLGFKPEDVAEAMFSAADDFNTTHRESSLEEVHFVLYHRDIKVIEAFQKQESLRGPRHVSKECIFGNISLKVRLGTIERLRTDCVIYLWEKHHMHSASPTLNAVLKHAGPDVIKKWVAQRDSKGKSKDTAFSTAGGGLKIPILVHVPCSEDKNESHKNQLAQYFLKGLKMADNEKARRVVVYFDGAHPILMKHCSSLGEALISAVSEYASHSKHMRDISLMVEGKNNFTPLFQYFTNHTQSFATGGVEDHVEPSGQEISGRDGEPAATGQAGLSGSQTQGGAKAGKDQWTQSNLHDDVDLRRYVVVNEVPARYRQRQKSLEEELPFPVAPPRVIYPKRSNKALFICNSIEDAAKLATFQGHKDVKFKPHSQALSKLESCCQSHMTQEDQLQTALEGTEIKFTITENKIVFIAPTTIQLQFAEEKVREIAAIQGRKTPKVEKRTSSNSLMLVETFPLSELQWDILSVIESETLTELQKDGSIVFDNGKVMLSSDKQLKGWTKLKEDGEDLQKKQTEEILLEKNGSDANIWCNEICQTLGFKCCIYLPQRKSVAAFCDKYEDLKKVKHQLQVKQGLIQPTARRRNFAAINESNADIKPTENKKVARRKVFDWNLHAQNLKEFKTKEGVVVKVYKANILNLPVDCIVNAANDRLDHGGGVARVIAEAAGDALVQDGDRQVREYGKISVGFAYSTTAGRLDYDCVIHAVGPSWYDYRPFTQEDVLACEKDLECAITNSFLMAEKRGLSSIALPAISSAIFHVPEEICAYQYALATVNYSKGAVNSETCLKEIHFIDINYQIIRKIQDMFEHILVDERRPYNIQKYTKRSSSPDRKGRGNQDWSSSLHNYNSNHEKKDFSSGSKAVEHVDYGMADSWLEPLKFESKGRQIYSFGSIQLALCKGNIFQTRADAFVRVVDRKGSSHGHISKTISKNSIGDYHDNVEKKFRHFRNTGDIVVTSGFNKDFGKVFHAVYPFEETSKSRTQRKTSLQWVYDNIFKQAMQEDRVNTLSMILIGTGQEKPYDIKLSAETFVDSFLVFYNRTKSGRQKDLTVQLVCWEEQTLSTVVSTLNGTIERQKKSQPLRPSELDKTLVSPGAYCHSKGTSDENYGATEETEVNKVQTTDGPEEDETCVICMDTIDNPRVLICGHKFCTDCIEQSLKFKQVCPTCGRVCGVLTGDQPHGTMEVRVDYRVLTGYEGCGSIRIDYRFRSAKQEDHHPNPGKWYEGIQRSGFLPDNREGNIVLEMLRVAFARKLVFTIGSSRTTGQEGVITWNDIHHKTNPNPHGKFGYPDPTYLERVTDELSAKGVTEKDIPEKTLAKINKRFQGRY